MRSAFDDLVDDLESDRLLTTGEAAKVLGTTRQHVVNLIERGDLPASRVGTHRRVRQADLFGLRQATTRATRDQRRSLWLGAAVAGKLVREPERIRRLGRERLAAATTRPNRWIEEWRRLLDGRIEDILAALTADTLRARELRQNSPFAGALTADERAQVLDAFREETGRRAS